MEVLSTYNYLMSRDVESIISSPDSLQLLRLYSVLYLDGGQPRTCVRSQRAYYNELKNTGKMKAELMEKVKNRTCIPNWKGRRYIMGNFYLDTLITDEQAMHLLSHKYLSPNDFKKLPDGFADNSEIKEPVNEVSTGTNEVKRVETRGRKPKIKR